MTLTRSGFGHLRTRASAPSLLPPSCPMSSPHLVSLPLSSFPPPTPRVSQPRRQSQFFQTKRCNSQQLRPSHVFLVHLIQTPSSGPLETHPTSLSAPSSVPLIPSSPPNLCTCWSYRQEPGFLLSPELPMAGLLSLTSQLGRSHLGQAFACGPVQGSPPRRSPPSPILCTDSASSAVLIYDLWPSLGCRRIAVVFSLTVASPA